MVPGVCCAVPGVPSYAVPLRLSRAITSGRLPPPPPLVSPPAPGPPPQPGVGSPGAGVGFLTNGPLYSRQSPHLHTRTFNYKGHHYKPRIIQKSQLPPGDTRHVSRMLTRPCPHYHPVCWKLSYLKFITSNPKFSNWPLNIFANNQ